MRSTVDAGGADPDNARRSGPVPVTFARRSAHLARAWRPRPARGAQHRGRYGGDRLRPVPGQPCAAAAAPVGLPPGRARAKLPPCNGEFPGDSGPPRSGHPGRSPHSLGCSRLLAEPDPAARPGAPEVRP